MTDRRKAGDEALVEELKGLKGILNVAQVVVSSLELDEVLQNILHSAMTTIKHNEVLIPRISTPSSGLFPADITPLLG